MKGIKTAYRLNLAIFILEVLANSWMFTGVMIASESAVLTASSFAMLKYFTVDSNIIMGICALIAAIDERKVLTGKKSLVSESTYVIKLMGTVSVALTMFITVFFLTPTMGVENGILSLYAGSNFFLHVLNPVLAMVTFVGFEKTMMLRRIHTVTGMVPLLIYAVYYVAVTLMNTVDGVIAEGYDWYGFFMFGVKSVVIVLPIVILITYVISLALCQFNRKNAGWRM